MNFAGLIGFTAPWVLAGLALLPVLWWLLRILPPRPLRRVFPGFWLFKDLHSAEETPHHIPWWVLALRLALAAAVILGLAGPVLTPQAPATGTGPMVIAIDDGFAAARDWPARQRAMTKLIADARQAGRPVLLITTAAGSAETAPSLLTAEEAERRAGALIPKPWPTDRAAAARRLEMAPPSGNADLFWLSDGLAGKAPADEAFAAALAKRGRISMMSDGPAAPLLALLPPRRDGTALNLPLLRQDPSGAFATTVRMLAEDGRALAQAPVSFEAGGALGQARFDLPAELMNDAARFDVAGQESALAVQLLDERDRRRPVGIVATSSFEADQPLLADKFYLTRALGPYSEVREGSVDELLARDLSVLILSDVGQIGPEDRRKIESFLNDGGVVIRFAGVRLARAAEGGDDPLMPVRLRRGGRDLGGALSWETPAHLGPFDEASPFAGLKVPEDVIVRRQVLADPAAEDLAQKTWARLQDGTPLVTAERRGAGSLVLFHVTSNPQWSNLPLSGLYVDMLRRLTALSHRTAARAAGDGTGLLRPSAMLDGRGRLVSPDPAMQPMTPAAIDTTPVSPDHPPGLYGEDAQARALNLARAELALPPLAPPAGATRLSYGPGQERPLGPWLLAAALVLLALDGLLALVLGGFAKLSVRPAAAATASLLLVLSFLLAPPGMTPARAQTPSQAADANDTRLAYVKTGNGTVDALSRMGLQGLSEVLAQRTAFEPAPPQGVDVENDELAFYPLLYWPVEDTAGPLSEAAARKIERYMKGGGLILFDTKDANRADGGHEGLRRLLSRLDVPPLNPVGPEHVLSKTFYLLHEGFPGRFTGGDVWAEAPPPAGGGPEEEKTSTNDGVSAIIVGGNDWASAWALDEHGNPVAGLVPGGEDQREQAYRFGVNLVMYALTGNYKTDQVHVPALLERLGQ